MAGRIKDAMKIIAFALVFTVVLYTVSFTVFSPQSVGKTSSKLADAYSFMNEPENSIDIVALGNSNLYSGFVPTILWEKYGYTSSVSAAPHQTPLESKMLLEQLLQSQKPQLVILETDMLYDGGAADENESVFSRFYDDFEYAVSSSATVYEFHNAWKSLKKSDRSHKYSHGYYYNNDVEPVEYSGYMDYTEEVQNPNVKAASQFEELVSFCKSNSIEILLLEMPATNTWNYARHNAVSVLARNYGVEFIDANIALDEIGIELASCFRDKGFHLNFDSASLLTEYVGSFIRDTYHLDSRAGEAELADYWDNEVRLFREYYKIA